MTTMIVSGCAALLPRSTIVTKSPWNLYREVEESYEKVVPNRSTVSEICKLGFDIYSTSNMKILSYVDIAVATSTLKRDVAGDRQLTLGSKNRTIKGLFMNSRINGSEYIEVAENVHLHICDRGKGAAIVFIPGWPFGHEMFEYQFNRLPQLGCRCIGISMRGFGKSSKPWGEYSYDIFADDLQTVLNSLALGHVTLVGFAMGGAIALRYMARHGGARIANLVLCSAAAPSFTSRPGFPFGTEPGLVQNFIDLCYSDRPRLNADFICRYFRDISAVPPQFLDWLQTLGMEASPYATAACLAILRDSDLRDDLKSVHVPTTLFHGLHDLICPFELAATMTAPTEPMPALAKAMAPGADAVAGGIQGARLVRFENSGHALFYEERERFNAELKDFIDKKDVQKEKFFGPAAR